MKKTKAFDVMAIILFLGTVFLVGSAYGYLSHLNHWFPHSLLRDARIAYEAWTQVSEQGLRPATLLDFSDSPPLHDASSSSTGAPVLITGGPYEFLEQCPKFGCLAWIVDRGGKVIHAWEADLEAIFQEMPHVEGRTDPASFMPIGMQLLGDGSLLVVFQGVRAYPGGAGLARFDRNGKLIWFNQGNMHHWFTLDESGKIYVPMHEPVETPLRLGKSVHHLKCPAQRTLVDYIAIVDADGEVLERINVLDLLLANGYIGLITNTVNHCNALHLNFVEYINAEASRMISGVEAGDLLISLRNINTILIFSPVTKTVKWIESGRYVGQHSPRLAPDGAVLVLDNRGGDAEAGHTRVVRQQTQGLGSSVVWPTERSLGERLTTNEGGHISVSPDGARALVSITGTADVLEVDVVTGEVLWRYQKIFPSEGYPHHDPGGRPWVRALAYGAYYVEDTSFAESR